MRLLALGAVLAGTLTVGASSSVAATPLTDYTTNFTRVGSPDPQAAGRWSERLATVPDLNGDGVNELLIGDLNEGFSGFPRAGRVYMQDGATRRFLYFVDAPEIQSLANFAFFISVIGDVNGDGKADFAAGTDAQDTLADGTPCTAPATGPLGACNQDQGKAWVFSGDTGQMLYALNNPSPQGFARFGSRIGRAGDVNNDGVPDVIVGASNNDVPAGCGNSPATGRTLPSTATFPAGCRANEGEAFIFSGKPSDHAGGAPGLLKTFNIPAADRAPTPCSSSCGSLGIAVQGIGDVTNDGVTDQLVDAGGFSYDVNTKGVCANQAAPSCNKSQGAEYVFNGATGAFIRRTDDPAPQAGATFGFQDAEPLAPGDVNGDGKADYYANGFGQDGPPPANLPSAGRGWVFDGGSGKLLYEILDPTPTEGGQFAFSLARTDYNKDGTPDLYAGQSPHEVGDSGLIQSGGTYIFDGKDGSLLKTLELPPSDAESGRTGNNGSNLGWTVAAPGDLNGDGEPDYVAGAPFQDVGPSALNCQAPDPGCAQDVGREYFFRSYVPPTPTSTTTTPTGTTTNTNTTTPSKTVVVAVTRKQPRLTSRVTKRRGHTKTTFHTTGRLLLPSGVSKARGCRGFVSVQIKHRTKTVSRRRATVRSNCTYSTTAAILNSRLRGRGRSEVVARFQGNTRLKAASASRKYI